ncbi:MAG: B12-binding domain-containing radical SAM protein [bacterium]
MKVLLAYPQYPDTFWSFKHVLKFVSKRAAFPPLGLLTVAAMLPEEWDKKLVDMNVTSLRDEDLEWADYVFISAMMVQRESVAALIERCKRFRVKIVAGGPLFTTGYEDFQDVDHLVLNEAEVTLPPFLEDLKNGRAGHLYLSDEKPDISRTPIPLWDLIDMRNYATMAVQYSRGCPFDCEFCDIIIMNGRVPRTKGRDQFLREFDALYERGWRGAVFVVDDNFIGNKAKVKSILPAVISWMRERRYPFTLFTEASINLADDEELMGLMRDAGFNKVFLGIETPDEESLRECNKFQNRNRDMIASIRKIQGYGMETMGGFIVGFDSDTPSIFERQINFIQKSGIAAAMVGLLSALPGTKLYNRLKGEGRIVGDPSGNNVDGSLNFIPKMDRETLMEGYRKIMRTIYSPKQYYERIVNFLNSYKSTRKGIRLNFSYLKAFLKSIWFLGIVGKAKRYYWRLFILSLFKYPQAFPEAIVLAIYGFHFQRIVENYL